MFYRFIVHNAINLAAVIGLYIVLSVPNRLAWISPAAFVYFPLEILLIGLLLLLPGRLGKFTKVVLALILVTAILLRVADLISHEVLGRPFDLIFDAHLLADGGNVLSGAMGKSVSLGIGLLLVTLSLALCLLIFVLLGQMQRMLLINVRASAAVLSVLLAIWTVLGIFDSPRSGSFTLDQLVLHGRDTLNSIRDIRSFAETVEKETLLARGDSNLLNGLQGKDVLIVFAESYGRVLLEREPFAGAVSAALASAEETLAAEGVQTRSAFLTSPVVGGLSWLAHASVLSGAWIDSETRFKTLIMSERLTLNQLFHNSGWRTVAAMPGITMAWPEGAYFGYDHIYNAHNFGYKGEPFNWVTMPDQYVMSALQKRELSSQERPPIMAEVALISSHAPWTPIAKLVPWDQVGDGRIFNSQARAGPTPEAVWREVDSIRSHYRQSIEYMLSTMVSYVLKYGDENLVLLLLGDHPPAPMVSGDPDASQVPVHLIARDPQVIDAVSHWQWQPGLLPESNAPVWRMDELRDRFVEAFTLQTF